MPRSAIASMGRHPSKKTAFSKSWKGTFSPARSSPTNASYSSRERGTFR